MSNRQRGEVELALEGTQYVLKLDMAAMIEAEEKAGYGLMGMTIRIQEKRYGAREIAALIWAGFLGAKRAGMSQKCLGYDEILEAMGRVGVMVFHSPAVQLLKLATRGLGIDGEDVALGKSEPEKQEATPT